MRLPKGWDEHAEWHRELGSEEKPRGYASTLPLEEEAGAMFTPYIIEIYPSRMDGLSDLACMWPFTHEFAHVASKLPSGSIVIEGKPYARVEEDHYVEAPSKSFHEDAADQIALSWGFDREMQSWLREDSVSS